MKSKETILSECSQKQHGFVPDRFDGKIWDDFVMEAMDIHARNCMIELIKWYAGRELEKSSYAAGIVDNFLASEYFKELQE